MCIPDALVDAVRVRGVAWAPREGIYPLGARCQRYTQLFVPVESSEEDGDRLTWLASEAAHFAQASDAWAIDPSFIPAITDFSRIIECGSIGDSPVCLDYNNGSQPPSVICWTGVYWHRIATDVETYLTMLEPWDHRKHGHPRPRTLAEQQEAEAILYALTETSSYDIWDDPVLVHVVYSANEEPTVVLLPTGKPSNLEMPPETDWQIRVSLRRGSSLPPPADAVTISTSGVLKSLAPDSPKRKRSQAAVVALSRLRHLCPPGILLVKQIHKGYFVDWTHLPQVIDGHVAILLSEELRPIGESW